MNLIYKMSTAKVFAVCGMAMCVALSIFLLAACPVTPQDPDANNIVTRDTFSASLSTLVPFAQTEPEEISLDNPVEVASEMTDDVDRKEVIDDGRGDGHGEQIETVQTMCTVRTYRAAPGYDELFLMSPYSVLYPGAVFDGNTIPTGEYAPFIRGTRDTINISNDISGLENSSAVINPSVSEYNQMRNAWLTTANVDGLTPPANSVLSLTNNVEEENFSVSLGVNISGNITPTISASLQTGFSYSKENLRTKYVARFIQKYYTVVADYPADGPFGFYTEYPRFDNNVSPVFVSSVVYGRQILFTFESNATTEQVSAMLNAALSIQDRVEISAEFDTMYKSVVQSSNVNSYVVGGSGEACNAITSPETLVGCIRDGGNNYQDGLPIAYRLRFLHNGTPARVLLGSEYNVRVCESTVINHVITERFRIKEMRAKSDTSGNSEMYGRISLYPTSASVGSALGQCIPANQADTTDADDESVIFNRNSNNVVSVDDNSFTNLTTFNFTTSVSFVRSDDASENKPNLRICADMREEDSPGSDDNYGHAYHVVDPEDITTAGEVYRFSEGNNWTEIRLIDG